MVKNLFCWTEEKEEEKGLLGLLSLSSSMGGADGRRFRRVFETKNYANLLLCDGGGNHFCGKFLTVFCS